MGDKIEAYWDCQYCLTKAIQGRISICPNCGKARGEGTEFYLKDKDNIVSDSMIEKKPDWYCSYCDTLNPSSRDNCVNCGSLRKESTENYFSLKNKKNRSTELNNDIKRTKNISEFLSEHHPLFMLGFAFIAIIVAVFVTIHFGEVTLDITEKNWSREIEIEEFKMTRESGWSLPEDAELAYTQEEVYTYNQILDHYETVTEEKSEQYISGYETIDNYVDLGNGYYENRSYQKPIYSTRYYTDTYEKPIYRNEPVYRTKYYYDAERWVYVRTESAEGNDEPYWPDISNLKDNERANTKHENYTITGVNKKNQKKTYTLSYNMWNRLSVGDRAKLAVSSGTVQRIKSIKSRKK